MGNIPIPQDLAHLYARFKCESCGNEIYSIYPYKNVKCSCGSKQIHKLKEDLTDEIEIDFSEDQIDKLKYIIGTQHENIKTVLNYYTDMDEDKIELLSLWILGTYVHKSFLTFPELFINAPKGTGKTRLLKLVKELSHHGYLVGSLRESVLFRVAQGKTLCIDEFESVGNKENQNLRELLNACYKKGVTIPRMKKVSKGGEEGYEVEEFEIFTPVIMANIWGMESVLSDRAVTLILEKSANDRILRLVEDYDRNPLILGIKGTLDGVLVQLCSFFCQSRLYQMWNSYLDSRYNYTHTLNTYNTLTTLTTPKIDPKMWSIFNQIHDSGVTGRNLELFLPLLIIASFISEDVFKNLLQITIKMTKRRREDEMIENRDILLLDYIAKFVFDKGFQSVKRLTAEFRTYLGDQDFEERWINAKWMGRALKRLNLIIENRRVSSGVEIKLDINKAKSTVELYQKDKREPLKLE